MGSSSCWHLDELPPPSASRPSTTRPSMKHKTFSPFSRKQGFPARFSAEKNLFFFRRGQRSSLSAVDWQWGSVCDVGANFIVFKDFPEKERFSLKKCSSPLLGSGGEVKRFAEIGGCAKIRVYLLLLVLYIESSHWCAKWVRDKKSLVPGMSICQRCGLGTDVRRE